MGQKTAQRYAYKIIAMSDEEVQKFADALLNVKKQVKFCSVCGNFSEKEICPICSERKAEVICVVKEPKDVIALEKISEFNGVYHVLHGTINPLAGIGPDQIRIKPLLDRIAKGGVTELIMATNPDVEGEATALYIAQLVKPLGIKVTRLANGIAVGTEIEYADINSLSRALADRHEI
ncbi:MAG: recombination protein RecR [Clostridia bacterium]|nr:recombination protein RecR [Clostridia bacterium]